MKYPLNLSRVTTFEDVAEALSRCDVRIRREAA
jgi:hypothetical protein